jgi:hypothetical protein
MIRLKRQYLHFGHLTLVTAPQKRRFAQPESIYTIFVPAELWLPAGSLAT